MSQMPTSLNTNHHPTITIIIPVHREDDRMIKALHCAKWADQIIIVDNNSGINFSTVKSGFKFEVISYPKFKDFSDIKNVAMAKASGDWIFFLDSDEWITQSLQEEIQSVIQSTECIAFRVHRIDVLLGKTVTHGEVANARFIRLVQKGAGKWQGTAHEEFIMHNTTQVGRLNEPLFHEPHTSIKEFIEKINFYTTILAKAKKERFVICKALFFPVLKFIYTYFFRLGFLDGYRGLIYCFFMSIHSLTVRVKRYENH